MTTHAQACAVLGHKFADLREAEGEMETVSARSQEEKRKKKKRQEAAAGGSGGKPTAGGLAL